MMVFYAPPSFNPATLETKYIFIDGASLNETFRITLKEYFEVDYKALNYDLLRGEHRKAFFYDAIPVRNVGENATDYETRIADKQRSLEFIARQNSFHVKSGDARHRRKVGTEQKMVDVQLAVDMMKYASRGVVSKVTLITGDLDFKPLIDALIEIGIDVSLLYPVGQTNEELIMAADRATPMDFNWQRQYLAAEFLQDKQFPSAYYDSILNNPMLFMNTKENVIEWRDEKYENCFIKKEGDYYRLITGAVVNGNNILTAKFKYIKVARLFMRDAFGVSIPDF